MSMKKSSAAISKKPIEDTSNRRALRSTKLNFDKLIDGDRGVDSNADNGNLEIEGKESAREIRHRLRLAGVRTTERKPSELAGKALESVDGEKKKKVKEEQGGQPSGSSTWAQKVDLLPKQKTLLHPLTPMRPKNVPDYLIPQGVRDLVNYGPGAHNRQSTSTSEMAKTPARTEPAQKKGKYLSESEDDSDSDEIDEKEDEGTELLESLMESYKKQFPWMNKEKARERAKRSIAALVKELKQIDDPEPAASICPPVTPAPSAAATPRKKATASRKNAATSRRRTPSPVSRREKSTRRRTMVARVGLADERDVDEFIEQEENEHAEQEEEKVKAPEEEEEVMAQKEKELVYQKEEEVSAQEEEKLVHQEEEEVEAPEESYGMGLWDRGFDPTYDARFEDW